MLLAALSGLSLGLAFLAAPPASARTSSSASTSVAPPSGLEQAAVAEINATRRAHGLRRLIVQTDLRRAARSHSRAMAGSNTLYHSDLSRIRRARSAAENVGYGPTLRGIHSALLRSRPHRVNLLDPRMRQVGVGVTNMDGRLWVTQIFRQPR